MRIIEKLRNAVEHTSDSLQQKLLNDFSSPDDIANQARKIIQELVKPLEKPNQIIINDIVSLIHALASNPDTTIDMDQVMQTAEILINELIKPIPEPNNQLVDELLHIIVATAKPRKSFKTAASSQKQANAQPLTSEQPVFTKSGIDDGMIKLLMDEMKEVIKKNQQTEVHVNDSETKLTNRIVATNEEIDKLKAKIKEQEASLGSILKNMDKFISLYEIVINQYNPFIEHVDEPKSTQATAQIQQLQKPVVELKIEAQPQKSQQQAQVASQTTTATQSQITDKAGQPIIEINALVEHLKELKEQEFNTIQPNLSAWCSQYLGDSMLASQLQEAKVQQDAVKLLLKKALKLMN